MTGPKPRNHGTMTEAKFHQHLVSGFRDSLRWWKPKKEALKRARVRTGFYLCAHCQKVVPEHVPGIWKSGKKKGKIRRVPNALADHIVPIVGPEGFTSWDDWIRRAFVEVDGYQVLCKACHDVKSKAEQEARRA